MVINSELRNLSPAERIKKIESDKEVKLQTISKSFLTEETTGPNIENFIGATQIPLGIAGPVKIMGKYAKGEYYLPLATTEGALVASVSRGCKAINQSMGVKTVVLSSSQTRSILFKITSIEVLDTFLNWVNRSFEKLSSVGEEDEKFIEILKIESYVIGQNVWLRIHADTNEAMGMNMITIASKKIGQYIEKNFDGIEFISESGNICVDKKPAAMNLINSRGKKVIASVEMPENVINDVLKTSSDKLVDMNYRKNLLGSAAAGSLGYNAHFANIVAAIFIATGQDAAHTVDGSLGFTTVEKSSKGVIFSVTLPDVQVGTIGGGTGLPTQKEALSIMGCSGASKDNSKKLAEIVASAVLAGEISLLGALCSKNLASSHEKLNR